MEEKRSKEDSRAKFLEALEKKRQKGAAGASSGPGAGSKVGGGQAAGAPKRFQRKSGSA
jgi:hypothetical protein